jgi:hypothetical protein
MQDPRLEVSRCADLRKRHLRRRCARLLHRLLAVTTSMEAITHTMSFEVSCETPTTTPRGRVPSVRTSEAGEPVPIRPQEPLSRPRACPRDTGSLASRRVNSGHSRRIATAYVQVASAQVNFHDRRQMFQGWPCRSDSHRRAAAGDGEPIKIRPSPGRETPGRGEYR